MGIKFDHKRRVLQHRRALQDQRFRPFLKRQWVHFNNNVWPEIKALYRAIDDYFGPDFSALGVLALFLVLCLALYLFGQVPV